MTRYLKLSLNRNGTGFLPGYVTFPQATDPLQKVKPFILDFDVSASLPTNNNQAGCIVVPDGATSANVIVFKSDGSTESLGAISLGSSGATSTVTLTSSKSAYKVMTNVLCWDITDPAEVKMKNSYFMTNEGPSWKPSSFNGVCFESGGRHIFWTNGSAVQLQNTNSYASIPALTGQQINTYSVPYKEITVNGLPDGNTHVLLSFTRGLVNVESYLAGSKIYMSTNFSSMTLKASRTECTDVTRTLTYSDEMDTTVNLTPVAWPVLTLKSTDPEFSIVCGTLTATSTATKTKVCEPNSSVRIVVHKTGEEQVVEDTIVMGSSKEVDAADYATYFPSDPSVDVYSVTLKSTDQRLFGTYNQVTVDILHPYTFNVDAGSTLHIELRTTESMGAKTLDITVESNVIIDIANYAYLFEELEPDEPTPSTHTINITNSSSTDVELVVVKGGNEYPLGTCAAGLTRSFTYEPSTYWNMGSWLGIAGFEYYIDFKVKATNGKVHTFQIVHTQEGWPSSYSHSVTDGVLTDEPATPTDMVKMGIGAFALIAIIGIIILLLTRR